MDITEKMKMIESTITKLIAHGIKPEELKAGMKPEIAEELGVKDGMLVTNKGNIRVEISDKYLIGGVYWIKEENGQP